MSPDETPSNHAAEPEPGPPPELADWWVWGVRKTAGVFAELVQRARLIALLAIAYKAITWALTNDPTELIHLGVAVAAIPLLWGLGLLLGRFSAERDSPDPERWLAQRRRRT
jgi:hypothetical protein